MSSKSRNHLFPPTGGGSLGNAHPLGGTSPTSSTSSLASEQRYVPYTPRQQRAAHPHAPPHAYPPQDPTTRLQLINLKLAAQNIGLEPTTVGCAILERLVNEAPGPALDNLNASPWTDIWNALAVGRATLLLPSELTPTQNDKMLHITPDFVKDHVAFIESSATTGKVIQLVTLSGLRGVLYESGLTFRSTLHPTSKLHRALIHPSSRASAFSHLPPPPQPYHLHLHTQMGIIDANEPNDQELPIPYPTFTLSPLTPPTQPPTIPIPMHAPLSQKPPPLPPRPSTSTSTSASRPPSVTVTTAANAQQGQGSFSHRLPNPFASLFGSGTSSAVAAAPPSATTSPATHLASLPPENASGNVNAQGAAQTGTLGAGGSSGTTVDVSALVIGRSIVRNELAREVNNGVVAEIAHALTSRTRTTRRDNEKHGDDADEEGDYDIPEWVTERVSEFVLGMGLYPFVHPQSGEKDTSLSSGQGQMKLSKRLEVAIAGRGSLRKQRSAERGQENAQAVEGDADPEYVISTWSEAPEDVSVAVQNFFMELEREVRLRQERVMERRRERERSHDKSPENGNLKDDEKQSGKVKKDEEDKEEESNVDKLVKRVIEAVETVLSSLFYDRLFIQPISDDASHDETLASRVAALNMVDLTLEHLDIDVGEAGEELELVVRACGEILTQLEVCCSPADKAGVLVEAHKVVVDGLTKLPPIKLIPEEESRANRSKRGKPSPYGGELKEMQTSNGRTSMGDEDDSSSASMPPIPTIVEPTNGEEPRDEKSAKKTKKSPPPLPLDDSPPTYTPLPPSSSVTTAANSSKSPEMPNLPTSGPSQQPKPTPTPVSGDILLPILIFSVVKSNPPHFVSHLLFTQRFRNQVVPGSGEESYCLINLMAVAEFLENVDLAALGLDKPWPSAAELTPIPIVRSPATVGVGEQRREEKRFGEGGLEMLRGKVEQQVDAIAGSANKVLAGVMDTSFGMLRSLLPGQRQGQGEGQHGPSSAGLVGIDQQAPSQSQTTTSLSSGAAAGSGLLEPRNVAKPGFGLLKRESGFSIANIAASLPINHVNMSKPGEEDGQQMITVSRPVSVRSSRVEQWSDGEECDGEGAEGIEGAGDNEDGAVGGIEEDMGNGKEEEGSRFDNSGVRSIRSFESMLGERTGKVRLGRLASGGGQRNRSGLGSPMARSNLPRKSLSDRLAHMSALAGIKHGSPPASRRDSLMPSTPGHPSIPPSRPMTPQGSPLRIAPPVQRFLECSPNDLKIAEVADLLQEYRRLAEAVWQMGGFSDDM